MTSDETPFGKNRRSSITRLLAAPLRLYLGKPTAASGFRMVCARRHIVVSVGIDTISSEAWRTLELYLLLCVFLVWSPRREYTFVCWRKRIVRTLHTDEKPPTEAILSSSCGTCRGNEWPGFASQGQVKDGALLQHTLCGVKQTPWMPRLGSRDQQTRCYLVVSRFTSFF